MVTSREWPRPPPHRALPGVRYSAPIRPSCQISTAFIREPSILRSRSVYNIILWPAADVTHFPGETSQRYQISIISNSLLIVPCRRQCFMPHLRSFIKELFPTSFIVHVLFKRIFNLCSMFRILNTPVCTPTPHGCLLERIPNLRCFQLQTEPWCFF